MELTDPFLIYIYKFLTTLFSSIDVILKYFHETRYQFVNLTFSFSLKKAFVANQSFLIECMIGKY